MRNIVLLCLGVLLAGPSSSSADYPFSPVPFARVRIQDSFWSPRMETNRLTTVWYDFQKCEETGRIDNFARAGKLEDGPFQGIPFDDSDVFKVIEGAAYTLATHPDPRLDEYLDRLIVKIAAAQEPDGYLYTARTIDPNGKVDFFGPTRWSKLIKSHELYNVGHLYEAAVAHFEATGKRTLLAVALKNADLVCKVFGPAPDQLKEPPGHQEIEIGLVKLFRATADRKYLEQAQFFCDIRGRAETHQLRGPMQQDHLPLTDQVEAVGHAVRAGYFYSGVADVAALTGNDAWVRAIDRLWDNVVGRKLHLTGGIGATAKGEAFGADYELPNRSAYLETCAAIANALWNHRMHLLHGDSKYIDVLERILYNGFLSGVSMRGDRFFYPNPLETDGRTKFNKGSAERAPWFGCSCCPVNDVRFIAALGGFVYTTREKELFVNLFMGNAAAIDLPGGKVTIRQQTRYPWDGKVRIEIDPARPMEFTLNVRVPGWAAGQPVPGDLYEYEPATTASGIRVSLSGRPTPQTTARRSYISLARKWRSGDSVEVEFPMPVREVKCHPAVKDNLGKSAIERGPLVYCAEGVDNHGTVLDKAIPGNPRFDIIEEKSLLGGITTIKLLSPQGEALTCIPYYAWCHRGPTEMRVWFPVGKP